MRITILAILIISVASGALAQGAIVTAINTDARTEGMGGSGSAVWWDDTPSAWANPALMGYQRGIGYRNSHSKLAEGLADDIFIDASEITLAYAGVGLLYAYSPFETMLDMGEQIATDEEGNLIGTFESYERSRQWGLGVSVAQLLDTILVPDSGIRGITRRCDLAGGVVWKSYEGELASDDILQDGSGGHTSASTRDQGLLARATIYDSVSGEDWMPALDRALRSVIGGWTLDVAYGRSWINWTDDQIVYDDSDQADYFYRENRSAWSVRWATGLPGGALDGWDSWLVDTLTPMISFGYAWEDRWPGLRWDDAQGDYVLEDDDDPRYREENTGWELTFLGVYSIRKGHTTVPYGDIDGDTEGWGLGVNLAGAVKVRYDEATRPQARGLPTVDLRTWTVVVDAFKLAELFGD